LEEAQMPDNLKYKYLQAILLVVFIIYLVRVGVARDFVMIIEENNIVSLSRSPTIIGASGSVDEAGRPLLMLDLSFANECVGENGIDVRFLKIGGRVSHVIVLPRSSAHDCPDIFNPVEKSVRVLLPSSLSVGDAVYLIGKPVSVGSLPKITLLRHDGSPAQSDMIVEATGFGEAGDLPVFEPQGISVRQDGRAYVITGWISVYPECRVEQIGAAFYEAPDENGEPLSDIIVLSAPPSCLSGVQKRQFSIEVNTPQPASGRGVYILNTLDPGAIPIVSG
jgi:hypothetical protein